MSSPWSRVGAVFALALSGLALTTAEVPAAPSDQESLSVRLDRINPAVLPRKGPLVVSGTVTNPTKEHWRELNVHLTTSATPIASGAALDKSFDDPDADVGMTRLQDPTAFLGIGDLKAGQSRRFTLRVPRSALEIPSTPGTYWLGAHVLGTSPDGRDDVADGRFRTLITQTPKRTRSTRLALVVPLRAVVRTHADGAPLHEGSWVESFGPDGRLERMLSLVEAGRDRRLTVVLDPAVADLAARLGGDQPDSDSPGQGVTDNEQLSQRAARWLQRLQEAGPRQTLLALGYADPDVASLSRLDPRLIQEATALSDKTMQRLLLPATQVVAPPVGVLPQRALSAIAPQSVVLLDAAKADHPATTTAETSAGQKLVFSRSAPDLSSLEMRQWLLAQTALRAGDPGTLVVSLPPRWDPGASSARAFFDGLRQPWLQLTDLPVATGAWTGQLTYPDSAAKNEFQQPALDAALNLIGTSRRYNATIVTDEPDDRIGIALQTVSYQARRDRRKAIAQSIAVRRSLIEALAGIHVVGRPAVNLAGGSGTLLITLVNELDQPVRVGLKAFNLSPGLKVTESEPVQLRAKQRTTVRLRASSTNIGVYTATISPVNPRGTRVGMPLEFSIRSSNVTQWVWGIMAAGAALLFGTIGVRLRRRGLHSRAEVEAHPELDPERAHHD